MVSSQLIEIFEDLILSDDNPKRLKYQIYKYDLLEALSVSFKQDYGHLRDGWSLAVELVKVFKYFYNFKKSQGFILIKLILSEFKFVHNRLFIEWKRISKGAVSEFDGKYSLAGQENSRQAHKIKSGMFRTFMIQHSLLNFN